MKAIEKDAIVAKLLQDDEYEEQPGDYVDEIDELLGYVGRVYVGELNERTGAHQRASSVSTHYVEQECPYQRRF